MSDSTTEGELTSGEGAQQAKPLSTPLRVFISYRLNPDQQLANALKQLIETSIDPKPVVFVSGAGGLKPSNKTFKQQLQHAATQTDAFVAIITNASKDREWIFFEAGAAWGRDVLYAPVLVGASADVMPDTIEDYFASSATVPEEMQRLMSALAGLVGASSRQRFLQRYDSFKECVEAYTTGTKLQIAEPASLDDAEKLMAEGDREAGIALFEKLENEQKDRNPEYACFIRLQRIDACGGADKFSGYSSADADYGKTATLNYYKGNVAKKVSKKLECYTAALEGNGFSCSAARNQLGKLLYQLGKTDEGVSHLLTVLCESMHLELTEQAAGLLVGCQSLTPHENLVLLIGGTNADRAPGLVAVSELAAKMNWSALHLYGRATIDELGSDEVSANSLGIAREELKLYSLAYESYSQVAAMGEPVGIANMANILHWNANSGASLKLLRDYGKPIGAEQSEYPHYVRARAEEVVRTERTKEAEIKSAGKIQFQALRDIAERTLSARLQKPVISSGCVEIGPVAINCTPFGLTIVDKPQLLLASEKVEIIESANFKGVLYFVKRKDGLGFVVVSSNGIDGIWYEDFSKATGMSRAKFTPAA